MTDNIITPEFRVSFPSVFRPGKPAQPGAEPKYGLTMLFPHPSKMTPAQKPQYDAFFAKVKQAADAALLEKFGGKMSDEKFRKSLKKAFRDQGEKSFEGYEEGALFANCSSKQRPGLVDAKNQDIIEEQYFYPGCYARASVRVFAYDSNGNRGWSLGLQNVQKLRDGEPLGGRTRASDDFQSVAEVEAGASSKSIFDD